jgi:hypothetical protein
MRKNEAIIEYVSKEKRGRNSGLPFKIKYRNDKGKKGVIPVQRPYDTCFISCCNIKSSELKSFIPFSAWIADLNYQYEMNKEWFKNYTGYDKDKDKDKIKDWLLRLEIQEKINNLVFNKIQRYIKAHCFTDTILFEIYVHINDIFREYAKDYQRNILVLDTFYEPMNHLARITNLDWVNVEKIIFTSTEKDRNIIL